MNIERSNRNPPIRHDSSTWAISSRAMAGIVAKWHTRRVCQAVTPKASPKENSPESHQIDAIRYALTDEIERGGWGSSAGPVIYAY